MPQAVLASDPYADFADTPPQAKSPGAPPADVGIDPATGRTIITVRPQVSADPYADFSDKPPANANAATRAIGTGEAIVRGAIDAATFGLAPTLVGLTKAGEQAEQQQPGMVPPAGIAGEAPGLESAGLAIGKMFGEHPDPAVRDAFERGRQATLDDQRLAQEQHPAAFLGGQFVGAMFTPGFGAGTAGRLGARLATGAIAGGIGGALYGAGSEISAGGAPADVAKSAAKGVVIGAPTGAAFKGVAGPRIAPAAPSAGERAAATAADLGAPLPRGITSDSPTIQATTAKLRSIPFAGEKISERVRATSEAAGERIGDISAQMTGGTQGRAVADTFVRPSLQDVIDANKQATDALYGSVRGQIDQNARFTMPRTDAMLGAIMRDRAAAGWPDPTQGLEQFRTVATGVTFNGAHRARVDARNAGNPLAPNPGYNAGDYNRLTRAMTADLRDIVQRAAIVKGANPKNALAAFDQAETQFGKLAEQNKILDRLVKAPREGAIGTLLGAAKEKSGNFRLLAQLRHSMAPDDFAQIGGTLLHELGADAKSGDFSLAKFVTEWGKLSDGAKRVLFTPAHLANINDIVGMGAHIKSALTESNTSHTGNLLVIYDLLKTGVEGAIAIGAGVINPAAGIATGAGFVGTNLLTRYLASPSKAAAMAAFSRAYAGARQNPTPARIAMFKIATRNMANTLGIDPQRALRQIEGSVAGKSDMENDGRRNNQ